MIKKLGAVISCLVFLLSPILTFALALAPDPDTPCASPNWTLTTSTSSNPWTENTNGVINKYQNFRTRTCGFDSKRHLDSSNTSCLTYVWIAGHYQRIPCE